MEFKYQLDSLFLDRHDMIYMVVRQPLFIHQKYNKVKITDPNYIISRVPDKVEMISKHDGSKFITTYPLTNISEDSIDILVRKENWKKI